MTLEQQIKDVVEAATGQLSAQIAERVQQLAGEIAQAASVERASVARELRLAAEAEIARRSQEAVAASQAEHARRLEEAVAAARQEAARSIDQAVGAARAEHARTLEEAVASVRAETAAEREAALMSVRGEVARKIEDALSAARAEHARAIGDAISAARAEHARTLDEAVAAARAALGADLASARAAEVASIRAEAVQALEEAVVAARSETSGGHEAALAALRADADRRAAQSAETARREAVQAAERSVIEGRAAERHAELAQLERLTEAVRRLDTAQSLTDVLDVLVETSGREAPRVALFLVRGTHLIGWRAAGLADGIDPKRVEIPLSEPGLLTRAVRSATAVTTTDAADTRSNTSPFGGLPSDAAGIAVPVRVGGDTVAVLYADDLVPGGREVPSAWPEAVELLSRHAARCLEVLTVTRAAQAAASMPEPPPRYAPQARAQGAAGDDAEDAARRYAKLLVSEIKLYHESAVTQGRLDRNLLDRLRQEIDRARRLYDERVPVAVRSRTDYFGQELVRTLANGDSTLLGSA